MAIERQPLHRQLAQLLREQIAAGSLPPGSRLPTEHELADRYGISRATVRQSLAALAAEGAIRRETGRGTFVNLQSAPTTSGGRLLGVIFTRLKGLFVLSVLAGIQHAAASQGYTLAVETSEHRLGGEEAAGMRLLARGVRGLLVEPSPMCETAPSVFAQWAASGCPVVFVDRHVPAVSAPWVASDNFSGGLLLSRHVLRLGHRRLAFILPREHETTTVRERVRGVQAGMTESGIRSQDLMQIALDGPLSAAVAPLLAQALDRLLTRPAAERPTAVICGNDDLASEVLLQLRERRLSVPEDIALAGFDDLPFAPLLRPALTTIRQDAEGMGRVAVASLLETLRTGSSGGRGVHLPVELRIRASTVGEADARQRPTSAGRTEDPADRIG